MIASGIAVDSAGPGQRGESLALSDRYAVLLCAVLLGYAILGKGFAYLGYAPLYVGELALLAGAAFLVRTGFLVGLLTTPPAWLLATTIIWVLLRTIPFIGAYGVDGLRDTVVVSYGGFAFVVIALLLEDGRRIWRMVRYYKVFTALYIPLVPGLFVISEYLSQMIPVVPGTDIPLIGIRVGELAVHTTGAALFVLIGFRKVNIFWALGLIGSAFIAGALSRGPMLAEILPVVAAMLLLGRGRKLVSYGSLGLLMFGAAYFVEPLVYEYREPLFSEDRQVSTRQVVNAVESLAWRGDAQTRATAEWRIEWWRTIVRETVFGEYFWGGRGFGVNLAEANGITNGRGARPLRDPHNVLMTMLARAGVPGAALWVAVMLAWFWMILRALLLARRRREAEWASLFVFLGGYVASALINGLFDPSLVGPMQGIWFWSLIGYGIGSVMVYRATACSGNQP